MDETDDVYFEVTFKNSWKKIYKIIISLIVHGGSIVLPRQISTYIINYEISTFPRNLPITKVI